MQSVRKVEAKLLSVHSCVNRTQECAWSPVQLDNHTTAHKQQHLCTNNAVLTCTSMSSSAAREKRCRKKAMSSIRTRQQRMPLDLFTLVTQVHVFCRSLSLLLTAHRHDQPCRRLSFLSRCPSAHGRHLQLVASSHSNYINDMAIVAPPSARLTSPSPTSIKRHRRVVSRTKSVHWTGSLTSSDELSSLVL